MGTKLKKKHQMGQSLHIHEYCSIDRLDVGYE